MSRKTPADADAKKRRRRANEPPDNAPDAEASLEFEPFKKAVNEAECLQWKEGLSAITKAEGRSQISAQAGVELRGSVFIDDDCKTVPKYAKDPRWDYVIGIGRTTGTGQKQEVIAHYVEVHGAHTSDVGRMAAKLNWLQQKYLAAPAQKALSKIPGEYHWVMSGKFAIPKHTPQYRRLHSDLKKKGLGTPVRSLVLR